ncbi:AbfB domain-containing protein [Streptomyces sp. NBC_00285]|uniref:AbfB domain-containing protein n=1 Tax=Streptomyces sp. NBC_00285 TaxID=2975700 RepID=UPI002E2CBCE8|nr:hypothetical protein [Streptomyces sp. NBC_00285]
MAAPSWSSFRSHNYPDRCIRSFAYTLRIDPIFTATGRADAHRVARPGVVVGVDLGIKAGPPVPCPAARAPTAGPDRKRRSAGERPTPPATRSTIGSRTSVPTPCTS